jgi:hypothetical protein
MRKKILVETQSFFGGKRDREELEAEDPELPVFPHRPLKFANPFKFFESHINPLIGNLDENETLDSSNSPTNSNTQKDPERDNSSGVRTEELDTKITKNDNSSNDDCDMKVPSPFSLHGPHQDEALNNDSNIGPSISSEEKESLPSSSAGLRSETPCKQLNFNNLTLYHA